MKNTLFLLLIIVGTMLISCNSSSDKSTSSGGEVAKMDDIHFFTTFQKMYDFKDDIAKEFGAKVKLKNLKFSSENFFVELINEKQDSVIESFYSNGEFKRLMEDTYSSPADAAYDVSFTLNEIPFNTISKILKNFEQKNACKYDSCVISAISIKKVVGKDNPIFSYTMEVKEYDKGQLVSSDPKFIDADENGNLITE